MFKKMFSTLLILVFVVSSSTICFAKTGMWLEPNSGFGSADGYFERMITDDGNVTLVIKNLSDVPTYLRINLWEDGGVHYIFENKKIEANETLRITRNLRTIGKLHAKSYFQNTGSEKVYLEVDFE